MPREAHHHGDDAPSYHDEPTSPAAEHIAPERRFEITVSGTGTFEIGALDSEDAEREALKFFEFGNPVEQWHSLMVSDVRELE